MGREIRRVPLDFKHPKSKYGYDMPMHDQTYEDALADWEEQNAQWEAGIHYDLVNGYATKEKYPTFEEWDGGKPNPEVYRPDFGDAPLGYCMYETVTEGTPVSPVFETAEGLAEWLVGQGYSREAVDRFIEAEWAPSMVMSGGQFASGVDTYDVV